MERLRYDIDGCFLRQLVEIILPSQLPVRRLPRTVTTVVHVCLPRARDVIRYGYLFLGTREINQVELEPDFRVGVSITDSGTQVSCHYLFSTRVHRNLENVWRW